MATVGAARQRGAPVEAAAALLRAGGWLPGAARSAGTSGRLAAWHGPRRGALYRGRAPLSGARAGGQWAAPALGSQHFAQEGNFAAVRGSALPRAPRVLPQGQRATCPGHMTQAAVHTGPRLGTCARCAPGGSHAPRRAVRPRLPGRLCLGRARRGHPSYRPLAGSLLRAFISLRALSVSGRGLLLFSSPGPGSSPSFSSCDPGILIQPHLRRVWSDAIPEDSATQLPATQRQQRGRPAGRVGRSGRRGPLPARARGAPGAGVGALGKADTVPACPAPGYPGPPAAAIQSWGKAVDPGRRPLLGNVPPPPARLSRGPRRVPRGGGSREFTLYLGPERTWPGSVWV